jgi:anti-sigma B factor antagonist
MLNHRPVLVMEMPEEVNSREAPIFLQELEPLLHSPSPRIILDCSAVRHIDGAGVAMMLHCLEQAMKRDGDLRLAALSVEPDAVAELGAFETFTTCGEAVSSFNNFSVKPPSYVKCYGNDIRKPDTLKKAS